MALDQTGSYAPGAVWGHSSAEGDESCEDAFEAVCVAEPLPEVATIRDWLKRVPAGERSELLPRLVALHIAAAWRSGVEPDLSNYVREFGRYDPAFASLATLPADVLRADLLARYEFAPHRERRTIDEYAAELKRPDVADLIQQSTVGADRRYILLTKIGMGGMGVVFACHDQQLRRLVAIKFPRPGIVWNARTRQRLAEEARGTAGLNHPGIVSVHEFDESDPSRPFYVMRLVMGETLLDRLRAHHNAGANSRGLHNLVTIVVSVCETVAYAHSRGTSHRDLKPANVKVGEFGEVTVLDWGLIKSHATTDVHQAIPDATGALTETPHNSADMTPPEDEGSGMVGSPAYMPPEQARGESSPANDIFGLGAIMYEVLTNRPPYVAGEGESFVQLLKRVEVANFPAPSRVAKCHVPRALEAICLKAMARLPRDRYGSAEALAADLRRWLTDEPVTARREMPHHKLLRLVRRHTGVSVMLALIALAAVAGTWAWQREEAKRASIAEKQRDEKARAEERELNERAAAAEHELNSIDALIAAGKFDPARSALGSLQARIDGPDRLGDARIRAQRSLSRIEAQAQITQEIQVRIPEFHKKADDVEFHILGALWTLLPKEETADKKALGYSNPRSPKLAKGIELARETLALYGLAESNDALERLKNLGLDGDRTERLRQRAADVLFLWSRAVERLGQAGSVEKHREACREASKLLDASARLGNDSRSLHEHRISLIITLGGEDIVKAAARAEARPHATFLDHHVRGAYHFGRKEYPEALAAFQRALTLRTQHYWTQFRMAKVLELHGGAIGDPVYLGQAEATFAACISIWPQEPTAHNNRGVVLTNLQRYKESAAAFETAITHDPNYLMAWGNLAKAYSEAKDVNAAVGLVLRFTDHPKIDRTAPGYTHEHARLLVNVGLVFDRMRDYRESIKYTTRALDLEANNVEALRNRAVAREKLKLYEGAEADIRKAISLRSGDGELQYVLGNILSGQNSPKEAVRAYDEAIKLSPTLWNARYNRGVVLRKLDRLTDAMRDQSKVIRNQPEFADAYFERAILQAKAGSFRGALDDIETYLVLEPNDARGVLLRGQIRGDLGKDLEGSEHDLTEAIKLDPKHPMAYQARGNTRHNAKNWGGALDDYRTYLRLLPKAPDAANILNNMATEHEHLGDIDAALNALTASLALEPNPTRYCNRGLLYFNADDLVRAVANYDAAIRLDPAYARAWGLRARAKMRIDDWTGAADDMTRALQLFPMHYETLTLRGFAYYAGGDVAAARKDWALVAKDRPDQPRGKFSRGALALLDGEPADAVEGLAQARDDTLLAPYATLLLARAWAEVPGQGGARAAKYADELVRLRPKDASAYLEAARVLARAAKQPDAAPKLRDRAIELLREALKRRPELREKLAAEPAFDVFQKDPRFPK